MNFSCIWLVSNANLRSLNLIEQNKLLEKSYGISLAPRNNICAHLFSPMTVLPWGGGGSSTLKVPGDVPPARVYFFGLLVWLLVYFLEILVESRQGYAFWQFWSSNFGTVIPGKKANFSFSFWSREYGNLASFV